MKIILKKIEIYVGAVTKLIEKNNNNNKEKIQVVNSVNKKKTKVVGSVNGNNRTLVIGFSNCGKTYLMNHILHQKQEPIFIITK